MPVKTKAQLQAEAALIANETNKRANTALRVGNTILDTVDSMANMLDVTSYGALTTNTGAANDTAIAAAITAAQAAAADLWWPAGTYPSAASIANLHSVRHRGPGAISRGSDTFYVEPKNSQTNRLYVATSGGGGSSANDGLSSSQPMLTAAGLFSAMANYGPMLDGNWQGIFAAGTYVTLNASFATPSRNLVTFKGPDPGNTTAVPTVIFDGTGAAASDFGMRATGPGVQVLWQDLKFTNYANASNANIALLSDYGSDLWTHNVHVASSTGQGVYGEGCPIVRMTGGIIDGCKQGILLNACGMVTVGYAHSAATDGIVRNCTQANIEWSRGTNGHCDYMTISGGAVGIDVMHDSRVHLMVNAFTSNTVAVRARTGGYYYDDRTLGGNTYTTNTTNWLNYAYSGESDADLWLAQSERRVLVNKNTITHTGTNATTVIATGYTIPANWFEDTSKRVRVNIFGEFTTPAQTRIGLQFGSTTIDQAIATGISATGTQFRYACDVIAVSQDQQLKFSKLEYNGGGSSPIVGQNSPTADTDADQIMGFTVKLNNSGDVAKIYLIEVWLTG